MKFGKLRLKNYVPFQSATFDLDYVGLTHIQAQNRDAENNNGKATNAAGKSRLFGAIPEAVWGQSPTGKDGGGRKASYAICFEVKDVGPKGETYDILRKFGGKKKGFKILRNNKDIQIRTMSLGEARAQEIVGMSEADFYTRVYLDSQTTHPLIIGSAANREKFFVDMFHLHSADSIRKLLLADYREAQKNRAAYSEVRAVFEEMREKAIGAEALKKKRLFLGELKSQQAEVLGKFRKTQVARDLLMFERDNAALIAKVLKLGPVDQFSSLFKECRRKLGRALELQETAVAWKVYDKEKAAYKETSRPIIKQLKALVGEDWVSKTKDVREKAKKARAAQAQVDSLQAEIARLADTEKPEKIEALKYSYEKCVSKVTALEEELKHVEVFHDGLCPTCGSRVKARPISELRSDLSKWKARRAAAKEVQAQEAQLDAWRSARKVREELSSTLSKEKSRAEALRKWIEAETLVRRIPNLPAPPGAVREEVDDLDERIDSLQKRINTFRTAKPVIDKIETVLGLTEKDRKAAGRFDKLGDELTELNNKVATLIAEIHSAREAHNQLQQLADRGKVLRRKAADEPILKALIEVHSKKGLKKMMIERHAKRLEEQINKFRRLLFTEDFKFEFRYDKELQLLVHRRVGKVDFVSDVRKLSGAERRMFAILLVVATVTLMPKNKRSNVLILDEPEANLGPAAQNNFVKALPILNKIIPHIIVVSPRTDLEIPGARVFTIVKQQGRSTIHKGAL